MPGLKKSPGLADIEVCTGAHKTGSSALQEAYQKGRRPYQVTSAQRVNSLDLNRYPDYPPDRTRSVVVGGAYPESASDESDSAETPLHPGFENRMTAPPRTKSLSFEESGLPPTPPTLHNSDNSTEVEQPEDVPLPLFADGVRNALHSKQSGQSVTPVQAVSPPTPDPSPPATTVEPPLLPVLPPMEQKGKPDFLHPLYAESSSAHFLRQYPSSRAESYQTARESPAQSPETNRSLKSPVVVPDDDVLPEHWLDSSRELQMATAGLGNMIVAETPREPQNEADDGSVTPRRKARRISKHQSPPQPVRQDSDWEKHISYVSGPDELDTYPAVVDEAPATPVRAEAKGLGLSGAGLGHDEIQRSAEDVNNMVYKRIQEENVKRHSVVSSGSGAITVGIILPADSTPKTLKRQTRCFSLRDSTTSNGSKRNSLGESPDARLLGHRKVRGPVERTKKLEASPVLESSIRQVSSPARLGPDASNMTALTYASLQDSPSANRGEFNHSRPETEHKLRHFSYGARLDNNPSVRRTSLHGSPNAPAKEFEVHREPEYPARSMSKTARGVNEHRTNVGIKRNNLEGAKPSRLVEKPRGVIPSVTSDTVDDMLERSPTTGRLRRFSRGERLENNDAVRRTSLDHENMGLESVVSKEREVENSNLPSPPERIILPFAPEKAVLPSSPRRKSVDVRHLHPTTTPMSTSQFSDRSEPELGEATMLDVRLYPHNNESLLLVQNPQPSRPSSKGRTSNLDGYDTIDEAPREMPKPVLPVFAAHIDPPTPTLQNQDPPNNTDSPLTNPRAAPEPPIFHFIPPTPNEELERTLSPGERPESLPKAKASMPEQRMTLLQRARRYSDSLFLRTSSVRRTRHPGDEGRATFLSPMWRPLGLWDSDSEEEFEDDYEPGGSLPRGGDTSDVEDENRKGLFPRSMSKRLPGFRGSGGFLVGNSLGLDRHGTNNRRHYVSTTTKTLSKKQSGELLRNLTAKNGSASQESLRRLAQAKTIAVPFSGGKRAQWVGTTRFRAKLKGAKLAREEKAAEKRREKLRGQIGPRVVQ